jgi:hypothetical protein
MTNNRTVRCDTPEASWPLAPPQKAFRASMRSSRIAAHVCSARRRAFKSMCAKNHKAHLILDLFWLAIDQIRMPQGDAGNVRDKKQPRKHLMKERQHTPYSYPERLFRN